MDWGVVGEDEDASVEEDMTIIDFIFFVV